jgi:polar amino acid transport system substrate-binding protein
MSRTVLIPALVFLTLGSSLIQAAECQRIRYATNPEYPPYSWSIDGKTYEGAAEALLRQAVPPGITLEALVYPWKRAQEMAARGKIDLLLAIRPTPEREATLDFTQAPAFPNPISVFTHTNSPLVYQKWSDLKGYRGGVSVGDAFGQDFDEYLQNNLKVEEAGSLEDNFRKLERGRIDYFISSYYLGQAYVTALKRKASIHIWLPPVTDKDTYFAFSKASPCAALLPMFDERLRKLNRAGVPPKLLEQAMSRLLRSNYFRLRKDTRLRAAPSSQPSPRGN